jgi:4'-phosphopantetheinyl transferase
VALGQQVLKRGQAWEDMAKAEARRDSRRRWDPAPAELVLHGNAVHVWLASLDRSPAEVDGLAQVLSEDERLRVGRYVFGRDRRRFTVARALLRVILSDYLHTSPEVLTFCCSPNGKPALSGCWQGSLEFNLSHSHEYALYAVTRGRKVGVDLECIRALPDADDIALRCFSKREIALIEATPSAQRLRAFFECWTRKEAFIKAIGEGLSFPLEAFDASLTFGEQQRLLSIPGALYSESRWTLCALAPDPVYAAALVVEGRDWHLTQRGWAMKSTRDESEDPGAWTLEIPRGASREDRGVGA